MRFDLKRPCKDCPFRSDRPGYLTRGRASEIVRHLMPDQPGRGGSFTCHKTTVPLDDDDDTGEMTDGPNAQHCAGALIMLEKVDRLGFNQSLRLAMRLGMFNPDGLDMASPVHTPEDFIKAQPR